MDSHMKTTLNIDDEVMQRLREEAARRKCTMSELVEAGLRRVLSDRPAGDKGLPDLPRFRSDGVRVDVADREQLYALMEND